MPGRDGRIRGLHVEGGPAVMNFASFQDATGSALHFSPGVHAGLSPATWSDRVRQASRDARKLRPYVPVRGVLGVEFRDDERWQLVEYRETL